MIWYRLGELCLVDRKEHLDAKPREEPFDVG